MNEKEIIDDLRRITMLTGELSSIHIKTLKMWAYVVFDNVEDLEIDYDITKTTTLEKGEGYMTFHIIAPEIGIDDWKKQGEFGKRCQSLTAWVRNMFWPEIRVSMTLNGQNYYTDSTIKTSPIQRQFKSDPEKSYSEAVKEAKKGPQNEHNK